MNHCGTLRKECATIQTQDKLNGSSKIAKSFGQAFGGACGFLGQSPKSPSAEGEKPKTSWSPEGYLWSTTAVVEIPFRSFYQRV